MLNNGGNIAYYLSIISIVVAVVAVIITIKMYKQNAAHHNQDRKDRFSENVSHKLEECYLKLTDFVKNFSEMEECVEKRVSREEIQFMIDSIVDDFRVLDALGVQTSSNIYNDIDIRISDVTYDNNFEKITRDLSAIKNKISMLRKEILLDNI